MDVAKRAGVSRATVSYVLNNVPGSRIPEATADRVRIAADELRFRPSHTARALSRGQADVILALMPPFQVSAAQIEGTAMLTAENARLGYLYFPFFMTGNDEDDVKNIAAVCAMLKPATAFSLLPLSAGVEDVLTAASVQILQTENTPRHPVNLDIDERYGRAQADALVERGSTRLGYVWPYREASGPFASSRYAGFRRRAAELGIAEPKIIRPAAFDAAGFDAAYTQSTEDDLDGIGTFDDDHGLAFLYAAIRAGRGRPRIIGVDGSPLGALSTPSLSSVYLTPEAVSSFLKQLQARMHGHPVPTLSPSDRVVAISHRDTTL